MKNQLSALIDGEIDIEEAEYIITAMKADGEVRERWKYYHLIGDAIRGDVNVGHDLSAKIMQALSKEPIVLAVSKPLQDPVSQDSIPTVKPAIVKTPVFWSVAASITAITFVGLMVFELQLNNAEEMSPVEIAKSVPMEYLQAHQSVAPSGAAYYIQSVNYTGSGQ